MAAIPPQLLLNREIIEIESDSQDETSSNSSTQSSVWDFPSPLMRDRFEAVEQRPLQETGPATHGFASVEQRSLQETGPATYGFEFVEQRSLQETGPATYDGCLLAIKAVFPDISHEHVEQLWRKTERANFIETESLYQHLIEKILDGGKYPKEQDRIRELKKRKRASPEVEAAKWKEGDLRHDTEQYAKVAKLRLSERFDMVPAKFIDAIFKEHSHFYGAFFAIEQAYRTHSNASPQPFQKLKSRRVSAMKSEQIMASFEGEGHSFEGLREEMRAAESRWQKAEDDRNAVKERARAKMASDEEYRRNGEIMECACCFSDDNPPTDMTHCDGDVPHFFCFACAKHNAETDMTSLKYALRCMDTSRCEATFSRDERARFLDAATIKKLERLQQQDDIRRAEMGDLETCPFCEYAAICPPPEVNKIFECGNPDCLAQSCRICREMEHLPLSCKEARRENGIGERHAIEEARTHALIRSCKKCNIRILKEDGCNKVICTNCNSVICDYCGEDISKAKYDHFDQSNSRVGGPINGKCPLYDGSNRKEEQIERAGKAAMDKVRAENPNLSEEDLKIKFAKVVEDRSMRPNQDMGLVLGVMNPQQMRQAGIEPFYGADIEPPPQLFQNPPGMHPGFQQVPNAALHRYAEERRIRQRERDRMRAEQPERPADQPGDGAIQMVRPAIQDQDAIPPRTQARLARQRENQRVRENERVREFAEHERERLRRGNNQRLDRADRNDQGEPRLLRPRNQRRGVDVEPLVSMDGAQDRIARDFTPPDYNKSIGTKAGQQEPSYDDDGISESITNKPNPTYLRFPTWHEREQVHRLPDPDHNRFLPPNEILPIPNENPPPPPQYGLNNPIHPRIWDRQTYHTPQGLGANPGDRFGFLNPNTPAAFDFHLGDRHPPLRHGNPIPPIPIARPRPEQRFGHGVATPIDIDGGATAWRALLNEDYLMPGLERGPGIDRAPAGLQGLH